MTDAVIPDIREELNRSTDLPAQEEQRLEEAKERQQVWDLTQMPGWSLVEAEFDTAIEKYRRPEFPKGMSFEDIGKEYVIAQTIATKLEEVFDDIRNRAKG